MIKGTTMRRGFAMVASVALAAAALPGMAAAQDDEVVVMTYFSTELGEGTLKELLADFEAESGTTVSFADVGPEDFGDPREVIHLDHIYLPSLQPKIEVPSVDLVQADGERRALMRDGEYV